RIRDCCCTKIAYPACELGVVCRNQRMHYGELSTRLIQNGAIVEISTIAVRKRRVHYGRQTKVVEPRSLIRGDRAVVERQGAGVVDYVIAKGPREPDTASRDSPVVRDGPGATEVRRVVVAQRTLGQHRNGPDAVIDRAAGSTGVVGDEVALNQ